MSEVRRATMDDARAVWEINSRGLGYDYSEEDTALQLRRVLAREDCAVFAFGSPAVGYVHVCDYEITYADSLSNILALAVLPEAQGNGAGRALMAEAEAWAISRGAKGMRLDSGIDRTGAHAFYRAIGYALRKDHRNFVKSFK